MRVKGEEEREEEEEKGSHSTDELWLVWLSGVAAEASIFLPRISSFQPACRSDGCKDAFSSSCLVIKMSLIDFGCLLFMTEAPTGARVIVSE